ncbi:YkgJ family cysteine cluster protein [Ferruginibacter lapsinanis]|uniref:YkgJ family cysteine cluster protein n=1 Tax=Ferruginibacter lapsinanis TaxID=563172 RepID=UPI001E56D7E4|nr:YkgJ family cysteine cluster protein [Ferruginibacter lapsinanis]UEG49568.1 YkgJ family cysteine cluster protein [Ferruginibacter lapsinanis]
MQLQTNLASIAEVAIAKEKENEDFKDFLQSKDAAAIDEIVHRLNTEISPKIDCTTCGNCCRSLMINVSDAEADNLANHLQISTADLKATYIEKGAGGLMIINQIPCHFLEGTKCSIYEHRFAGCRAFPHLDLPKFTSRLFSTFMYYSMCPIIFNVVETLKTETGFTPQI